MGLIIKNFFLNGTTFDSVYANINKERSFGSLQKFNAVVTIYASVDNRVKNINPISSFNTIVDLSEEESANVSVFKVIYNKLKEQFPETKDYKDLETSKIPVITSVQLSTDGKNLVISGTMTTDAKLVISGIPADMEYTLTPNGKNWVLQVPKEANIMNFLFISIQEKDMYESDFVQIPKELPYPPVG